MKRINKTYNMLFKYFVVHVVLFVFLMGTSVFAQTTVGLYDIFEIQVSNSKVYSNPFDFNVIELRSVFISPSGKNYSFFGFYDGDGIGGQTGNIWKQRFMPDEIGTWNYTYSWSDGTAGASGSFETVDTGIPGPLKIDASAPWYFEDARGKPFDWRGYGFHHFSVFTETHDPTKEIENFKNKLTTQVIDSGYNFIMLDGVTARLGGSSGWHQSWWLNTIDTKKFNVPVWSAYEEMLTFAKEKKLYAITFNGMIHQGAQYGFIDFKVFLHYFVARFAAYYNFFGWSPTWEWPDIWTPNKINEIMQYVYDLDPWKRPLSAHDATKSTFTGWMGFTTRQHQVRSIFQGNDRISSDSGATPPPFIDMPIIGSEDIWEMSSGQFGNPRNATEVRRGAWGEMLAGVMPLYSEWTMWTDNPGNMPGETEVIRMFDFFYSKTRYRKYQMLNSLVSSLSRQLASGIPGQEYLVYDEDGGTITINLSGTSGTNTFSVLWFDPKSGVSQNGGIISGGAIRSVSSPFTGDSVLLLGGLPTDTTPPSVPVGLGVE